MAAKGTGTVGIVAEQTEIARYVRIAGMTSIIGFIVGYDPNLLIRLMDRILSLASLPLERGPSTPSSGRRAEMPLPAPSAAASAVKSADHARMITVSR